MSSLAERIGSWSTPALPPFLFLHAFFRGAACVPFFAFSALVLPLRLPPFLSLPLPPPPPEPSSGKETELPPCLLPPVSGLSRPTATPSVAPSMSPSTPIFNISHICTAYRRPFPSSPPSSSPQKNLLNASTPALAKYYSIETQVGPSSTPASSSPPTVFPPTFLYHSEEDATVPIENSILLAAALRKANVGAGRHDKGGDGGR